MTSHSSNDPTLAEQTVQTLSGNPANITHADGIALIDQWLSSLGHDPVANDLSSLKNVLQSRDPNIQDIPVLLMSLSRQTATAASQASGEVQRALQQVAAALEKFSRQLELTTRL